MDLFGTAGIRGDVQSRVTPALARAVGRAAGADGDSFVVGRDGRTTGEGLAAAVEAGLLGSGADVTRIGQVPTPALAYAAQQCRGVMVTASHNPPTDNGLKLFADGEEYGDDAEARIERRVADDPDPVAWDEWGSSERADVLGAYRDAVAEFARGHGEPLDGLSVAVDCGNGMASLATPQVLRDLGADVTAIHANVDGHFPGRESKPTPESLRDLRSYLAEGDADLGIGHDGDADRIVVVDASGEVVHEDTIVAVLAEHYTAHS
ncbi:phosphohexomutase (phosphoglucomutase,phosphomannomutase), partial [Halosimplex carlsbadense 2-9-1]